jgi:hypothetical protein
LSMVICLPGPRVATTRRRELSGLVTVTTICPNAGEARALAALRLMSARRETGYLQSLGAMK